jgi:hypothetical protein
MEPEFVLRLTALVTGLVILFFTLIDFNWILDKLLNKDNNPTPEVKNNEHKNDKLFLHIVDLWYKLKYNCELYNLKNASDKLDEVFPLLNDKSIEDTK